MQVREFSLQSQEVGAAGGPASGPLYFLPGRPRIMADVAAASSIVVGYLDDMSHGGEADRVAEDFTRLRRAQQSSASHSIDPSVRSPGSTNATRSILAARGWCFRRFHCRGLGSPRISTTGRAEGSGLRAVYPSGMIWRHWPADCLSCFGPPRQPLPLAQRCDHATSHVHAEDGAMHGQQGARVVRMRCCGQPCPQPSTWTCADEGWQQSFAASTMGGSWGFVVLLCWHLLPTWHQPLALRTLFLKLLPSCLHHISDWSTPNTSLLCLAVRCGACNPSPVDLAATPSAQLG